MAKNTQSQIDKVTELKDQASAKFDKAVTASEKKIFDEAVTLISELEKTTDGKIKPSVANLKRLAQIRTKLAKVANNKDYLQAVKELAGEFDRIYQAQAQYFASLTMEMHHESKYATMKQLAVENTVGGLAGAGLQSNVTDKLNDMLLRAVTSGAKYADLVEEMRTYLRGDGEHPGALTRYASTYTVTALGQYAGQNNKLLTDDLGCEWFEYTGSEIETTREFCEHLCKKRWIHKSEIPEILKGHIEGHNCKIYAKTKLPYGLIEGTNAENFQVNVGGWNCRHQLVPVAKEMVPQEIRAKFEKPQQQPQNEPSEGWKRVMREYGTQIEELKAWTRNGFTEVETAIFEYRTQEYEPLRDAYYRAYSQMVKLKEPLWTAQTKLTRLGNKAAKEGRQDLADKATATIDANKVTAPASRADLQRRISALETAIQEIKAALNATPKAAPKAADGTAMQTKEITMATLRIHKLMPKAEIFEKRAKYLQRTLKVQKEDAEHYVEAIESYTGNYYDSMRAVQMGDIKDRDLMRSAEHLEEFIGKSPKWGGGTTYRGIYRWEQSDVAQFTTAQATRMPIQMYGCSSWSTSKEEAKDFAMKDGEYHILFICKGGQPRGTSIAGFSRYPQEKEILCSKDGKWMIDKIYQPDPTDDTYYEIEVTPC